MKYSLSITALALASTAFAAYVPSEPWSTLTPAASITNAMTDYSATFGIAIEPLTQASGSSVALQKRDVVTQIGDGQIQATTSTSSTSTKAKTTSTSTAAAVVTQIGDGQIQAVTTTTSSSKKTSSTSTAAAVVTQIGDGQIQAATTTSKKTSSTSTAAAVVTQIGDGQIQATTSTAAGVVTQIGDGQIQASTSNTSKATSTGTTHVVTQISDGQLQASTTTSSTSTSTSTPSSNSGNYVSEVSCYNANALAMTLKGGVLTDSQHRIGSIVANRQFQFDGPTPQAGAIYAAGWSISSNSYLTLGNSSVFYQCLSGTFYNLYDESIGSQCHQVHLKVVELVDCSGQ